MMRPKRARSPVKTKRAIRSDLEPDTSDPVQQAASLSIERGTQGWVAFAAERSLLVRALAPDGHRAIAASCLGMPPTAASHAASAATAKGPFNPISRARRDQRIGGCDRGSAQRGLRSVRETGGESMPPESPRSSRENRQRPRHPRSAALGHNVLRCRAPHRPARRVRQTAQRCQVDRRFDKSTLISCFGVFRRPAPPDDATGASAKVSSCQQRANITRPLRQ